MKNPLELFASFRQQPNPLHNGHLLEGVKPIRASIIENEQLDYITKEAIDKIEKGGEFVNYDHKPGEAKASNMLEFGAAHIISDCNTKDKYSKRYGDCTGVACVGTDKNTEEQISLLTHQDPKRFLEDTGGWLERDLTERLKKLQELCVPGTVDVVVYGGKGPNYKDSIKTISSLCKSVFNFEPVIMTGPNVDIYDDESLTDEEKTKRAKDGDVFTDTYLDTQKRRLYIIRPPQKIQETSASYLVSNYKKESKKWDKRQNQ
jgi:hypothetical protein